MDLTLKILEIGHIECQVTYRQSRLSLTVLALETKKSLFLKWSKLIRNGFKVVSFHPNLIFARMTGCYLR